MAEAEIYEPQINAGFRERSNRLPHYCPQDEPLAERPVLPRGAKMLKLTLVALFVMSMATLTIAASALPIETAPVPQIADLG